jgi:hypothetical protein
MTWGQFLLRLLTVMQTNLVLSAVTHTPHYENYTQPVATKLQLQIVKLHPAIKLSNKVEPHNLDQRSADTLQKAP